MKNKGLIFYMSILLILLLLCENKSFVFTLMVYSIGAFILPQIFNTKIGIVKKCVIYFIGLLSIVICLLCFHMKRNIFIGCIILCASGLVRVFKKNNNVGLS